MTRVVRPTLLLTTVLFAVPAAANEQCPELARNASKAAQDYRHAVGKVRTACDSSFEECVLSRSNANQALALLAAANQAMLEACEFTTPTTDDSLPITAATVAAAIDTLPTSVLVPCATFVLAGFDVDVGCSGSGGWVLNLPRTTVNLFPASATSFTYLLGMNASGAIPISSLLGSCTLNVSAPELTVNGSAIFSSATEGGTTNRLQLTVTSVDTASVGTSGCGVVSAILDLVVDVVSGLSANAMAAALSADFCGADGPELFGTCP